MDRGCKNFGMVIEGDQLDVTHYKFSEDGKSIECTQDKDSRYKYRLDG